MNHLHLNKHRRAIPMQRKQFASDTSIVFLPIDGIIAENNANASDKQLSSDDTSTSQLGEVSLTLEIPSPTMKIHRVKSFFRRAVPDFITCQRLWFAIDILITIILCVLYFTQKIPLSAGTIATCELLSGILVQNENFLTLLYYLIGWIPFFKYEFNRTLHCMDSFYGSSAIGAFLWLLISLCFEDHGLVVRITGGILLFLIISLSLMTMSIIRHHYYNTFEYIYRYVSRTCFIILIIHVLFLQLDTFDSFTTKAIFNVPVLALVAIVIIVFLPWQCIQYKQPSKELTIITFPQEFCPYDSTTRILLDGHEWHAYAITLSDQCIDQHPISVAGMRDGTKNIIEDHRTNKLLPYVWIRQIKGLDFMYSIRAYRKVLIICTDSDIAPAVPYIKESLPTTHIHLLWSAQQYEYNYGEYIWQLVQKTSPHFTLHDTAIHGQPNPQLIEYHFWKTNSEAVFIVSNEAFTEEVQNTLWRKGIDCFGALFDS